MFNVVQQVVKEHATVLCAITSTSVYFDCNTLECRINVPIRVFI